MTTITGLGVYARNVSLVRTIGTAQKRIDEMSSQLTSGVKSTDLKAYGAETQRLLDLRTELVQRRSHISAIETALPRVKAQDLALDKLVNIASDLVSTSTLPINPGRVEVATPHDADPSKMKITVNAGESHFTQNATYTVTAVPSKDKGNGAYDITLHDGMGGRSTTTVNLSEIPDDDGWSHTFAIGGGPGDGSTVSLTIDSLKSASSSSFQVSYPDIASTKNRIDAAMGEVQGYLNERFGDRYLFAGSRYDTAPVIDFREHRQVTKVTLEGMTGAGGNLYELDVDGRRFTYAANGEEADLQEIAGALTDSLNTADPPLALIATSANGVITLTGRERGEEFAVKAKVHGLTTMANSFTDPVNSQTAILNRPQVSELALRDEKIDIGDTYKIKTTVGDPDDPFNARYYQNNPDKLRTDPDAPPLYQEFEVAYTVTEQDYNDPTNPVQDVTAVMDKLRSSITNAWPAWPATPDAAGSETLVLTGTRDNVPFAITPEVINGELPNTMTVSAVPSEPMPPAIPVDPVEEPALPDYDTDRDRYYSRPEAWDRSAVTFDEKRSLSYGVVATDGAFQELINGMRYARAAAENPGHYTEYMEQARNLLVKARDDIRQVSAKNASDMATLETARSNHDDAKASVVERIASIEQINQTEVTARLRTAVTSLEATYTVTGATQKLSLINYLA